MGGIEQHVRCGLVIDALKEAHAPGGLLLGKCGLRVDERGYAADSFTPVPVEDPALGLSFPEQFVLRGIEDLFDVLLQVGDPVGVVLVDRPGKAHPIGQGALIAGGLQFHGHTKVRIHPVTRMDHR